jgi:ABC-type transport system involved in multi-copper enzyme maturation permease subunit
MMRVVLWKELREQRLPALILTALGVAVMFFVVPMWAAEHAAADYQIGVAACFAWACAMVTGTILFANESETHTLEFLDSLPRSRSQIWLAKFNVALLITLIQIGVFSIGCCGLNEGARGKYGFLAIPILITLTGLHGLGCGLFGSILSRTVLNAIGWALACLFTLFFIWGFGVGVLMMALALLSSALERNENLDELQGIAAVVAGVLVMPLPILLSYYIYTGRDRKRGRSAQQIWRPQGLRPGWGVKSTLWLSFQQGKFFYLSLLIVFLILMPLLFVSPWLVWPVLTLILGTAAGVSVFADEQFLGSFRFLAEQRLPLGRIWWTKTLSRFFAGGAIGALLLILGLLVLEILGEIQFGPNRSWGEQLRQHLQEGEQVVRQMGGLLFIASWFIYGLAFGQLAGMLVRKSFVAVAISLMASVILLSVWIPSLVSGGLHGWQFLAIPVAMLVLSRLLVWPWATERLYSPRAIAGLTGALLLALLWIAGSLAYRVWEVPAAPVPFDVAQFEDGFPKLDDNLGGNKIRQAASRMAQSLATNHVSLREEGGQTWGSSPAEPEPKPILSFSQQLDPVEFCGWTAGEGQFSQTLTKVCDPDWLALVREAADLPPGYVEDPRHGYLFTPAQNDYRGMGRLLAAHALQVQAEKKDHAGALELLRQALAMARHVQTRAEPHWYWQGAAAEASACRALQQWASVPEVPAELLQKALAELQRHEQLRPPYSESIKASYVQAKADLAQGPVILHYQQSDNGYEENVVSTLVSAARIAPWEMLRRNHLLNEYYALHLQGTDMDYPTLKANFDKATAPYDRNDERAMIIANFLPPVDSSGQRALDLWRPLTQDLFFRHIRGPYATMETYHFLRLTQVRATRIVLALLLYQKQHGQPAEKLSDLVPAILSEVPIDPYSNQAFRYRISSGELIAWSSTPPEEGSPVWWDPYDSGGMAPGAGMPGAGMPGGAGGPPMPMDAGRPGLPPEVVELAAPAILGPAAAWDALRRPLPEKGKLHGRERIVRPGTGLVWSTGPDTVDNGGVRQNFQPDYAGHYGNQSMAGYDIIFLVPNVVGKKK